MLYIDKPGKNSDCGEVAVNNLYIRSCNDTLFKTKIDDENTPFKTKPSENHTFLGRTSPLRPYKKVPLPPGLTLGNITYNVIATRRLARIPRGLKLL